MSGALNPLTRNSRAESGSVLLISLTLTGIMAATLGGYLWWIRSQNLLVAESQAWNGALAAAEAGIEDAMGQINVNFGTNYAASSQANWGGAAAGPYGPRTVVLTNSSYTAIIIPGSPGPTLIATGFALAPIISHPIQRTLRVTTTTEAAFAGGIAAQRNIVAKGNNIMVDSYDSADPAHSTGGRYDPAKRKAGGDVATVEGVIQVGTANIYGHAFTAPWGNVSTLQNGRVGDLPPSASYPNGWAGASGIEAGWWRNDYNMSFKDVAPPFDAVTGLPVSQNNPKDPGYATNSYTLGNGNYIVGGDFKINNNETLYITGNATLWVQGNFAMSGQGGSFINIAPGYTLRVYVGTPNTAAPVSATFTTVNESGANANAWNFQYYGLPSNTATSWSGNASYMGTVYAPEAVFTLGGSGTTVTNDYQGSCVVQSVVMNGHFNIHYDENLKRRGPISGFTVTSWREL